MKKWLQKLRQHNARPREVDIPSWTEIKSALFPVFDEMLAEHRLFRQKSGMLWTEKTANQDGIRQVFELRAVKGAALLHSWGISLDFVPHLSGESVKWHRTFLSARSDIWIEHHSRQSQLSFLYGIDAMLEEVHARSELALQNAVSFWAQADAFSKLPKRAADVIDQRNTSKGMWHADNVPQHYLALAFIQAKANSPWNDAFDRFVANRKPAPSAEEKLREMLLQAATVAALP